MFTNNYSSVLAANQGEAPRRPAHHADRPLRWSSLVAGHFNATSGVIHYTAPVTGVSVAILPSSTGSGTVRNISSSTSTSGLGKTHHVSIVTVTARTTVTETSCSVSSLLTGSFKITQKSLSALSTALPIGDVVKSILPITSNMHKTNLGPVSNIPESTVSSPALNNAETSKPVVAMVTKTVFTTTWTSVVGKTVTQVPLAAKPSDSSAIDDKPQQPIDQASGKPVFPPKITFAVPIGVLTKPTTSCTSNSTASPGIAGTPSGGLQVSRPLPTVHTGMPVVGATESSPSHPTPRIPVVPNLPFGHPPLFSNETIVRSHTTLSFYHEKPTVHPGTASVLASLSRHHVSRPSTTHQAAKCTTTFHNLPTHPCTSTHYVHTKTIAVDCYDCVGEQAHAPKPAYHEGKVRFPIRETTTIPNFLNVTNRFRQVCKESAVATVTLPVSRKTVCAGPMMATGGIIVHSKGKFSSTHVASSGFVTSTSAVFHGAGYGHGNWTGRA